jgi:2-polyprenyl-3-methyl-5-hydroxy-6-metoxy-1,4-benzoquinol methylase
VKATEVEDLVARRERERIDADRRYNDALTAVDRAVRRSLPDLPAPPPAPDVTRLGDANSAWDILPGGPPAFDRSLKGRLGAFVWRLVGPPLESQRRLNATLVDHLNRAAATQESIGAAVAALIDVARREIDALIRFESLLVQYLQTVTAFVDTRDQSVGGPDLREQIVLAQARTLAVQRRLDRMVDASSDRLAPAAATAVSTADARVDRLSDRDAFGYVKFEDRFRGSREEIRRRLRDYLPLLAGASNVVDVGCGRGEFLELMREQGMVARGIDTNVEMIALCRERGLAAEVADAVGFLAAQPDATLGGLTAIQVVEHFEPPYLARFLEAAYRALEPGSLILLETINPSCWMAFFETYLRDLTHARPLHPDTLRFLVQASGFSSVDVVFRAPVTEGDRLPTVTVPSSADPMTAGLADVLNAHADRLNARLFGSMDYALTARKM